MKTKQILLAFVCLGCAFCLLNSCSKNLELIPSPVDDNSIEIQLKNGMLVFPSRLVLSKVLSGKEDVQMNQFVEIFTSQKDLMDEVVQAEQEYMTYLDTLKEVVFETASEHSGVYDDYLQRGIIKKVFYGDGTSSYDLNLAEPLYAKVINRDGYFAIKDTIFQITPRYKKIWLGGDLNNYMLLNSYTKSSESENIFVVDYSQKITATSDVGESRTNFPITIRDQNVGMYVLPDPVISENARLAFIFYDRTTPIFAKKSYLRDTYCRVICQKRKRDTNEYGYELQLYNYSFFVYVLIDGVENMFGIEGSATGYNDYYTVYTMYQMMVAGHEPFEFDGEYYQISKFDCRYYWEKWEKITEEHPVPGKLATATVGIFMEQGATTPFKYYFKIFIVYIV